MLSSRRTVSFVGLALVGLGACALPAQAQEGFGDVRIKCHTVIVDVPPNMHPGFTVCPPA